jgi:hypothetical protein
VASNQVHDIKKVNAQRYARIPDSVLFDASLTPSAVRVYAFISRAVWQGTTARIGLRLMASKLKTSRSVVSQAIARLGKAGHITITASGRERTLYTLNSPVFGQKQGKEEIVVTGASGNPTLASVRKKTA